MNFLVGAVVAFVSGFVVMVMINGMKLPAASLTIGVAVAAVLAGVVAAALGNAPAAEHDHH